MSLPFVFARLLFPLFRLAFTARSSLSTAGLSVTRHTTLPFLEFLLLTTFDLSFDLFFIRALVVLKFHRINILDQRVVTLDWSKNHKNIPRRQKMIV